MRFNNVGAIEIRHANDVNNQEALTEWQVATANPEEHPQWLQFHANALRDALRKKTIAARKRLAK